MMIRVGHVALPVLLSWSDAVAALVSPREISVTDGDTIRVAGEAIRPVGFNAPETGNAKCDREGDLARQATQRLKELIAGGVCSISSKMACACRSGTEGTQKCPLRLPTERSPSSGCQAPICTKRRRRQPVDYSRTRAWRSLVRRNLFLLD